MPKVPRGDEHFHLMSEEIFLRSLVEEFCQSRKLAKSHDASDSTDALAFDDRSRQSHIVGRTQVLPSAPTYCFMCKCGALLVCQVLSTYQDKTFYSQATQYSYSWYCHPRLRQPIHPALSRTLFRRPLPNSGII